MTLHKICWVGSSQDDKIIFTLQLWRKKTEAKRSLFVMLADVYLGKRKRDIDNSTERDKEFRSITKLNLLKQSIEELHLHGIKMAAV